MPRTTQTWLGLPFDSEIFIQEWSQVPDPQLDAIIASGVVVASPMIAAQITHGNYFTIPYYNIPGGEPANYDGMTDVPLFPLDGTSQSGVVYGRTIGWYSRDFQGDLSGGDPMANAVNQVATYWRRQRQKALLGTVDALFNMSAADDNTQAFVGQHTKVTGDTISETDIGDLAQKSLGDNDFRYNLAIMHSRVARKLARLNLLQYRKYTDIQGIERQMRIADIDGLTVVIDDLTPHNASTGEYSTFIFGTGTFLTASGALNATAETRRDPKTNGGQDELYTRQRITMHPNGFRFKIPEGAGWTESPTDAQLFAGANWELIYDHKVIPMAKLVTTEGAII